MFILEDSVIKGLREATKDQEYFIVCVAWVGSTPYVGWNSFKTTPDCFRRHPDGEVVYGRHAEDHCIGKIPRDANGASIKVVMFRLKKNGMGNAKPCKNCERKLLDRGIKPRNIWFTNSDGLFVRLSTIEENEHGKV